MWGCAHGVYRYSTQCSTEAAGWLLATGTEGGSVYVWLMKALNTSTSPVEEKVLQLIKEVVQPSLSPVFTLLWIPLPMAAVVTR